MKPSRILIIFALAIIIISDANTAKANTAWQGAANETHDWHTATNWDNGLPGAENAVINNGGTALISTNSATAGYVYIAGAADALDSGLILSNQTLNALDLELGDKKDEVKGYYDQYGANSKLTVSNYGIYVGRGHNQTSSEGYFTLHNGEVETTGNRYCYIYLGGDDAGSNHPEDNNGKGTFTILDGLVTTKYFYCGYKGTGIYNQSGGSNSLTESFFVGYTAGSTGTVTLTGGNISTKTLYCGNSGNGTYNQSGGSNQIITFYAGYAAGSTGTVTLTGGNINSTYMFCGEKGNGTYNQTGGTNTVITQIQVGHYAGSTGTVTLSGGKISTPSFECGNLGLGTYNQSGGTNTVGGFFVGHRATGNFTLSGGTFQFSGDAYIGNQNNATGTVTISGGTFEQTNTTKTFWLGSGNADSEGSLIIQGGDASITVGKINPLWGGKPIDFIKVNLTFVLDGKSTSPGNRISTINCTSAKLDDTDVTVEYKLGDDFQGRKNDTYTLISSVSAINTNGCNFVDASGAPADTFTISLENSGKELVLTQHRNWPVTGSILIVR